MSRIGSTIRSANRNAMTPPKLIPPFHSTAARGTFLIEQTNEMIATTGPMSGPTIFDQTGSADTKKACQNSLGTQAARAPAINRPSQDVDPDHRPIHHEIVADRREALWRYNA